jgi:hypothetical protein
MRALKLLIVSLAFLCASCGQKNAGNDAAHVLFVGNSLTYVGNTPAVFSALSKNGERPVVSEMIVEGGATLSQRLRDGSVARALSTRRYSAVILQERGGDLLCSFGPDSCTESRTAIKDLSALAKSKGAKVVLLGTYQSIPKISLALVESESAAAKEAGIPYVEISEKLQTLQKNLPDTHWFAPDGMHPSSNLALLNAIAIFEVLYNSTPPTKALTVLAPIYGTTSGLTSTLRNADSAPPSKDTPLSISYQAKDIQDMLSAIKSGS